MDKILTESLLHQLKLMKYDRSKTISEQLTPSDRLGSQGQFQPLKGGLESNNFWLNATNKQVSDYVYKVLKNEVNSPSTNEELIYRALKRLNKESYDLLLNKVKNEKPGYDTGIQEFRSDGTSYTIRIPYQSIIEWIQDREFQGGELGKDTNKTWLKKYNSILSKFGDFPDNMWSQFNKFEIQNDRSPAILDGGDRIGEPPRPFTDSELATIAHYGLPILGIVLTLGTAGAAGIIAAGVLDLVDAAIYYQQGDKYSAGLAAMFLIFPLHELVSTFNIPGLKGWTKKMVKSFINKVRGGKPLTSAEKKILNGLSIVSKSASTAYKLTKLKVISIMNSISDINLYCKVLIWLVNKGLISTKFITKFGLTIGGIFYSWSVIAEKLGIKESGGKPTTKSPQKKLDNETNYLAMSVFDTYMSKSSIISIDQKNYFSLPTLLIQYALKGGGYDKVGKNKLPLKWGYYDENTKKIVESYQKDMGLNPDGVVGPKTFSKLISDIKKNKFGQLINYSGHKLTPEEEKRLFNMDVEKQSKISESKLQKEFEKQNNKIKQDIKLMEDEYFIETLSREKLDSIYSTLKNYKEL
jgi:hypothetical protein